MLVREARIQEHHPACCYVIRSTSQCIIRRARIPVHHQTRMLLRHPASRIPHPASNTTDLHLCNYLLVTFFTFFFCEHFLCEQQAESNGEGTAVQRSSGGTRCWQHRASMGLPEGLRKMAYRTTHHFLKTQYQLACLAAIGLANWPTSWDKCQKTWVQCDYQ